MMMVALVGQSVVDRVKLPGCPWVERLGGAPVFAAAALRMSGRAGVIVTRGASEAQRAPLHRLGFKVVEGPAGASCVSEMVLSPDGVCADSFIAFGDPFTPADVEDWMAPALAEADAIVCGAQWREDFPEATLSALARTGRPVYLDGQGPLRLPATGPLRLAGPLDRSALRHVTVLKLAEEEAHAALGGIDADAARALGVPVVVVTLGERGAVLLMDGDAIPVPVEPVSGLADTVGAGDAFLALMASAGVEGATPLEAARFACDGTAAFLRARLASPRVEPPSVSGVVPASVASGSRARGTRPAVLLDFGGTLDADGIPWKARARRLFHDAGLGVPADEFDPAFHAADDALVGTIPRTLAFEATVDALFHDLARRLGLAEAEPVATRLARQFAADSRATLRANVRVLHRLTQRYRLGIVSNFYGNLPRVCRDTGIARYFDVLIDSARVGHRKPEPAIFRCALDALGVAPDAVVFVGDSLERDMAGARQIPMRHIWLMAETPAPAARDGCCAGDLVIGSLRELDAVLP
jgi:HAD superfamily hydrolase (TIGR01509 family)